MTRAFLFWFLMLLALLGIFAQDRVPRWFPKLLMWVVIALLGWVVYGDMVK